MGSQLSIDRHTSSSLSTQKYSMEAAKKLAATGVLDTNSGEDDPLTIFIKEAIPDLKFYNKNEPIEDDYQLLWDQLKDLLPNKFSRAALMPSVPKPQSVVGTTDRCRLRRSASANALMIRMDLFYNLLEEVDPSSAILTKNLQMRCKFFVDLLRVIPSTSTFIAESRRFAHTYGPEHIATPDFGPIGEALIRLFCGLNETGDNTWDLRQWRLWKAWERVYSRFLRYLVPTLLLFDEKHNEEQRCLLLLGRSTSVHPYAGTSAVGIAGVEEEEGAASGATATGSGGTSGGVRAVATCLGASSSRHLGPPMMRSTSLKEQYHNLNLYTTQDVVTHSGRLIQKSKSSSILQVPSLRFLLRPNSSKIDHHHHHHHLHLHLYQQQGSRKSSTDLLDSHVELAGSSKKSASSLAGTSSPLKDTMQQICSRYFATGKFSSPVDKPTALPAGLLSRVSSHITSVNTSNTHSNNRNPKPNQISVYSCASNSSDGNYSAQRLSIRVNTGNMGNQGSPRSVLGSHHSYQSNATKHYVSPSDSGKNPIVELSNDPCDDNLVRPLNR
mmetsp:Transcript_29571/g.49921  ORF Transcript_29571/g.49921 Transcript_29571/m.49921 type:complete len:554 (+) Transcript_29571:79-1740(+)